MHRKIALGFLLLAALSCAAQTTNNPQGSILYDDFNHTSLQPSKWKATAACYTTNGVELECVRQIQNRKLHLAHRTYGNRDTNTGLQFGDANVLFTSPSRIKSITAEITVLQTAEGPCPANPLGNGQSAQIDATFFNAGSGNPNDDVGAQLVLGHYTGMQPGQTVIFGQINHGNDYLGAIPLGGVSGGTPVITTLAWDQPNHQFIASWIDPATNVKTETTMPYTFPDTTPTANPSKDLSVNTFPANCTASPASTFIEATFDNVYVSPSSD